MTDTKLDPRSLTNEERAIVEEMVTRDQMFWAQSEFANAFVMNKPEHWQQSYECAFARILARRALFGQPASEPAKVECPNCRQKVAHIEDHGHEGDGKLVAPFYGCKPAQPEPAAEEMPFLRDELSRLLNRHSRENHSNTPDFVLAGFLMDSLCAWERATGERDTFFGQNPRFATEVNGPERAQPAQPEPVAEEGRWSINTVAGETFANWVKPEPVAKEMPEAVLEVVEALTDAINCYEIRGWVEDAEFCHKALNGLRSFWRTHAAQPAKVREEKP